jgi:hypothetical protein
MKSKPLNLRVHPEQLSRWREAAKNARRTLSDWVRTVLDEAAGVPPGEYAEVSASSREPVAAVAPRSRGEAPRGPQEAPLPSPLQEPISREQTLPPPSPLAANCRNAEFHWRLRRGEKCIYCRGVA